MIFISLFFVAFIYGLTLSRFLWTVDAGDLLISAYLSQLAHPPGYPLYLLILRFAEFISPVKNPALNASTVSAFFSICSLFFIFLTMKRVLPHIIRLKEKNIHMLPIIVINICAFLPLWWMYSIVQEVFMATVFFVSVINYLFVVLAFQKKVELKQLLIVLLVFSFAFFHQYIILLAIAPFIILFFYNRKALTVRFLAIAAIVFPIGFLPYLLFLKKSTSHILWYKSETLVDLLYIAFRRNYGTFAVLGRDFFKLNPLDSLTGVGFWFSTILDSFGVLFFFVVLGLWFGFKTNKLRIVASYFFLQFFLVGVLFSLFYPILPSNMFSLAISERFVILSFPSFIIFTFFGFAFIYYSFSNFSSIKWAKVIYLCIIAFIPILLLIKHFTYFHKIARDQTIELLGKKTLLFLPKNALLIVTGDILRFPVEYAHYIHGLRTDVIVIPQSLAGNKSELLKRGKWLSEQNLRVPNTKKRFFDDFVAENAKYRPVFSNFTLQKSNLFLQVGPVYQYSGNTKKEAISYAKARDFFNSIVTQDYHRHSRVKAYGIMETRRYFSKIANYYSEHFMKNEDYLKAQQFAYFSYDLYPQEDTLFFLGFLYYKMNDCKSARDMWTKNYELFSHKSSVQQLRNIEAVCFNNMEKARYWQQVLLKINPK